MGNVVKKVTHSKELIEKVFLHYITTSESIRITADKFNLSVHTVTSWAKKYKWKLFRKTIGDKLEGILELSQDRVQYFEALTKEMHGAFLLTNDIREKALVVDTILKLDKRISAWLLLGEMAD